MSSTNGTTTGSNVSCETSDNVIAKGSTAGNTASKNCASFREVTYTNATNTDTTKTEYFGAYFVDLPGQTYNYYYEGFASMSYELTEVKVSIPSISGDKEKEYTGSPVGFSFNSNKTLAQITEVVGSDDISLNDVDFSAGTFKPTQVGTYTLTFELDTSVMDIDISWFDNTTDKKYLTFEITPQKVDIPYVDKNSQEYKSEELIFSLLDFDSDLVNVVKVEAGNTANSATGAGGAAITPTTKTFEAVNADTYTVTLKLADEDNYVWDDEEGGNGTRDIKFTVTPKELSLKYESSHKNTLGNAEWKADDKDVTITVTEDSFDGDDLSLIFYYDAKGNSLGTSDGKSTELDMTGIESGGHTLYVDFAEKTGVDANYTISNGSYPFNVKAGSAQTDFKWVYYEGDTKKDYIAEGGTITFKKDTTFKVELVIPDDAKIEVQGYETQSGSAVKSYETTVTIKSTDPGNLFYDEDGNSSETTTITLNWSIVQAEVDVEKVKFEYNDGKNGNKTYDPDNPPEYTGLNFTISVPEANFPDGVTNISVSYVGDRKGPGTINFSLEFTLDGNYKSSTGGTTVPYSMNITGKKVSVGWTLTELKDENGNEVKDENGVTYQVYVLDLDKSDPVYKYIN
ncbi:MAG: hypothetical protein K2H30_04250, partial [Clostridia bacterium]|nr:hypothetical protein [Clostridia bacterium]